MRIAFIVSYFLPDFIGGAEISTFYIARGLQGLGQDVTVFTEGRRRKREYKGIPIVKIPLPLRAKPLLEKRTSKKIARVMKPQVMDFDIYHAHDFRAALALSEMGPKRTVVTVRDYAQICGNTTNILTDGKICPECSWQNVLFRDWRVKEARFPRNLARVFQYKYNLNYRRQAFQKINKQVFISKVLGDEILKRQKVKDYAVIYNPCPPEYLAEEIIEKTFGKILYVGQVEEYKGVGILLQAFARFLKWGPAVRYYELHIAGSGSISKFKRLVGRLGIKRQVKFLGKVSYKKIKEVYQTSDFLVHPALWIEPFGRTIIEANALGKPVIATNQGGPKETILDGRTGFLVRPGDIDELVQKMKVLIKDPEKRFRMGKRAREHTRQKFHPDKIAQEYLNTYRDLK